MGSFALNISYRGQSYSVALSQDSTFDTLAEHLEECTGVPPAHQKLLYKGKKPPHTLGSSLQASGFVDGMKIQLVGPTAVELGEMYKAEDQQRTRDRIMRERNARGTVKVRHGLQLHYTASACPH